MADPTLPLAGLSPVDGNSVVVRFDGGHLSLEGGRLALREVTRRLKVTERLAACVMTLGGQGAVAAEGGRLWRVRALP
ncbi:IS1380 family transposase, partial [Azospirillum sp. RWY-5-1]|nr:IS1380 family transposase [Azospirillum oleiclasticum]NYZ25198.1 IS1380 family transposase [Azospirillum oleiclasticum]